MTDTAARAQAVANDLVGTCGNLCDHATPEEINDRKFCDELDSLIFECQCCGWWWGIEEMEGDENCADCWSDNDR